MGTLPLSLVPILVALACAGLVAVGLTRWVEYRERKRLLRRLGGAIATSAPVSLGASEILRQSTSHAGRWWRLVQRTPFLEDSDRLLEQAGLTWSGAFFARAIGVSGLIAALAGFLLGGAQTFAFIGFCVGLLLPPLYVRRRRARRLRVIEEQLPEVIDLLGRSIRAGHAITTALRLVAEESPDPIASEFRRVFDEQKYGMPFEESLLALTRRVDLVDVRVMVVAMLVQREVGGNLAEILDKISHLIRARFNLRRQVRVYTAQGRMSGVVLGGLPIGIGFVIELMNPGYVTLLFHDPRGRFMLAAAAGLQLIGYFWMSRILKLDL